MSEEPQSIWKKPWKGPRGLFLWFIVLACATFVAVLLVGLLSATTPISEVLTLALICSIGVPTAGMVLWFALVRWLWRWRNLTIWKKPWKGPRGLFLWFIVVTCGTFVAVFALQLWSKSGSSTSVLPDTLISAISIAAAIVLLVAFLRWLCRWRNLKRVLFGIACLVTLIALFYAEENWRGKRAWENYKREWEAKGEKFDLASVSPPQVPDDQNFAMTPIWVETICATMGAERAKIWYGDKVAALGHTNFVWRLRMPVEFEGSGLKFTNRTGTWRTSEKTDLKAWQHYYRTPVAQKIDPRIEFAERYGLPVKFNGKSGLKVITNNFPVSPQEQTPPADVLLALSKYDAIIEELRQASRLPFSRFPLGYSEENPAYILLPHLGSLQGCTITLQLRAVAELQSGQTEKALDDIKLMFRLIESIHSEPLLISSLVRIAMLQILLQPIWEGMADHRWTDAQLAALDAELGKLDFLADYHFSMRGERVFIARIIDYGRASRKLDKLEFGDDKNRVQLLLTRFAPGGWFEQNKVASCRMNFDLIVPIVNRETRTVSSAAAAHAMKACNEIRLKPYNWLTRPLLPWAVNIPPKSARAQSYTDTARIACSLERYRLKHGEFPETLDALTPQFMEKIPHDIIGGQPLKYRRTDAEHFILYSVGWNEKDDGGIYPTSNTAQNDSRDFPRFADLENSEEGDWVWRYPVK